MLGGLPCLQLVGAGCMGGRPLLGTNPGHVDFPGRIFLSSFCLLPVGHTISWPKNMKEQYDLSCQSIYMFLSGERLTGDGCLVGVVPGVGVALPASADSEAGEPVSGGLWLGSPAFLVDDCAIRAFNRLTQVLPKVWMF